MTNAYVLRVLSVLITGALLFFAGNLFAEPEEGGQKQVFQLEEQLPQQELDTYQEEYQNQDDGITAQEEHMQPPDVESYGEEYQDQDDSSTGQEEYIQPEDRETYQEEYNEPSEDAADQEDQAPLEEDPPQEEGFSPGEDVLHEEPYLEEDHNSEDGMPEDTEPISGNGQEIPDQQ